MFKLVVISVRHFQRVIQISWAKTRTGSACLSPLSIFSFEN